MRPLACANTLLCLCVCVSARATIAMQALRLFVESVLRYGLPPNYSYFSVNFRPDDEKRMRTELQKLYGHLDKSSANDGEVCCSSC